MPKCRFYGLFSFIFTYIHILSADFSIVRQTVLNRETVDKFTLIIKSSSHGKINRTLQIIFYFWSIRHRHSHLAINRVLLLFFSFLCLWVFLNIKIIFPSKTKWFPLMKMVSLQPYAFKIILDAIRRRQFNRIKERRSVLG